VASKTDKAILDRQDHSSRARASRSLARTRITQHRASAFFSSFLLSIFCA